MKKICFRLLVAMLSATMLVGAASALMQEFNTYSFHPMTCGPGKEFHMGFLIPSDADDDSIYYDGEGHGGHIGSYIVHLERSGGYSRYSPTDGYQSLTYMKWQQSIEGWPVNPTYEPSGTRVYSLYRLPYTIISTGAYRPAVFITSMTMFASDIITDTPEPEPLGSTFEVDAQRSKITTLSEFQSMFDGHQTHTWDTAGYDNWGYQSSCMVGGTEYWSGHYNCGWSIIGYDY